MAQHIALGKDGTVEGSGVLDILRQVGTREAGYMKMKRYKFRCNTGFAGAIHEDEIELPVELSEAEVEDEFKEWVWNLLDTNWTEVEDND